MLSIWRHWSTFIALVLICIIIFLSYKKGEQFYLIPLLYFPLFVFHISCIQPFNLFCSSRTNDKLLGVDITNLMKSLRIGGVIEITAVSFFISLMFSSGKILLPFMGYLIYSTPLSIYFAYHLWSKFKNEALRQEVDIKNLSPYLVLTEINARIVN